jgi:hypothetical protein
MNEEDPLAYRCVGICTPDQATGRCIGCGRPMDDLELVGYPDYYRAPTGGAPSQSNLPTASETKR